MTKLERDAPAPRPTRAGISTWAERSPAAQLAATAIHSLVTDKGAHITIGAIAECIDAAMKPERDDLRRQIEHRYRTGESER